MDRSQVEEPEIKRQDRPITPDVHESDNHNKTLTVEPCSSTITNPNNNPDQTVRTLRKPISERTPNLREEERKAEARGAAFTVSWRSKHYTTHVASTPQSELVVNTEANLVTGHSDTSPSMSHAPSQTDSDPKTDAKEEPGLEFSATQDPMNKASDSLDGGHILKLPPNPERSGGGTDSRGTTVDTWPGRGRHGLVFQEMEEDEEKAWSPKEGPRSRRRRSWIWNQFFVIEEYAGPEPVLIGRLHTDMDRGDGRTRYVLRGEGAGSVFVIDEKTGNIHVTKPLDREEKDEYRLIATATDSQTERALEPSSQFIIRVQDINDNPPVFEDGPYSATVPEMANIGTSIVQVTATDADDPTYGNSARLVYTLVQGQPHFSVDPQTGILRTAVPDLDRETQDQYLVVLQAKDMGGHLGGLSGTTTVTVKLTDVNDNPPHFTQSTWLFSVSELAVPGAEVGRISATDADLGENAKLEYTILEGESGDTFNITGVNQEAIIILNKAVDYESRSSYSFSVEVLNPTVDPRFLRRGPFKDRASVRVAVLDADEPPRFSRARYRMDVSENCPPACTVGRVSAVDPDTGLNNNIRYSIDPQSDPEALFRIAPDTGLITTAMELDREHEQWHNVTIIATQRDNPSQVSRVVVAIETLDLNDNAPELDRQYNTAMCDSASAGQVVQVLRAIDRDEGGNDSTVHFNIPPESSAALNFSIRESGGPTASLVLASPLQALSRSSSSSSSLTLHVPLILRDGSSGLTSTGTVTVSVCPCLKGGARAGEKEKQSDAEWERETVCLPQHSSLPSPGLSTAALLAILACVATLLAVSALSLSLRRQKRDSLSPLEEDDVRENIITYDDEGGGEADTAAFDITALQSAPHSAHRGYRTLDSRNIRYSQRGQDKARTYSSWAQSGVLDSGHHSQTAPLYGRLCYSSQTLPVLRRSQAPYEPGLAELGYRFPGGQPDHSLVIQNQGAVVGPLGPGALYVGPGEAGNSSREGTASQDGATASEGGTPRKNDAKEDSSSDAQQSQDLDWRQHEHLIEDDKRELATPPPRYRHCYCSAARPPGSNIRCSAVASLQNSRWGSGLGHRLHALLLSVVAPFGAQGLGAIIMLSLMAAVALIPIRVAVVTFWPSFVVPIDNAAVISAQTTKRKLILTRSDPPAPPRPKQVQSDSTPREQQTLVLTRSGSLAAVSGVSGSWACDSATLPSAGRRSSRAGMSPKKSAAGSAELGADGAAGRNYATVLQGDPQRDYTGSLGRGGLEMGSNFVVYPESAGGGFIGDWRDRVGLGGFGLGRRDMTPQLLPYPSQGPEAAARAASAGGGAGGHSLALRVGEFLRLRLAQVTFDPTQPPYDSVQVYGLEGTGSRAGSLSSLESEGEKDGEKEEWGGGLEEWGPQFRKLAQLFRDREKEKDEKDGEKARKQSTEEEDEKEEQSGDERKDKD
ncbi:cadherin-11 [Colossoma macropomum]|uniref:cadherin-11 n=1 Tax=Colossoma macropomum TaxID=42526 RepID=UPI001863BAB3|nr:cadherin-11 [Colossoma macropomum]